MLCIKHFLIFDFSTKYAFWQCIPSIFNSKPINEQVRDFAQKKDTLNSIVLYNESDQTNIYSIHERRCLLQILYIIQHSYTTSLKN